MIIFGLSTYEIHTTFNGTEKNMPVNVVDWYYELSVLDPSDTSRVVLKVECLDKCRV